MDPSRVPLSSARYVSYRHRQVVIGCGRHRRCSAPDGRVHRSAGILFDVPQKSDCPLLVSGAARRWPKDDGEVVLETIEEFGHHEPSTEAHWAELPGGPLLAYGRFLARQVSRGVSLAPTAAPGRSATQVAEALGDWTISEKAFRTTVYLTSEPRHCTWRRSCHCACPSPTSPVPPSSEPKPCVARVSYMSHPEYRPHLSS